MGTNLENLNPLIPIKEVTIKKNGEIEAKKLKRSTMSNTIFERFYEAGDNVQVVYRGKNPKIPEGPKIPERMSFMSSTNDSLYVDFDEGGSIYGLRKCEKGTCSVVSKNYCYFVYTQLGVKTRDEFEKRLSDSSVFSKVEPQDDLPQLARIFHQGREFVRPVLDSAVIDRLKKMSTKWDEKTAESYTNQFRNLNSPIALNRTPEQKKAHLNRIVHMCKVLFPNGAEQYSSGKVTEETRPRN